MPPCPAQIKNFWAWILSVNSSSVSLENYADFYLNLPSCGDIRTTYWPFLLCVLYEDINKQSQKEIRRNMKDSDNQIADIWDGASSRKGVWLTLNQWLPNLLLLVSFCWHPGIHKNIFPLPQKPWLLPSFSMASKLCGNYTYHLPKLTANSPN